MDMMMLQSHFRKLSLGFINFFLNHRFVFSIIGAFNRRLKFLSTLFVCYPADEGIALGYVYPSKLASLSSTISITGIYLQNGKIGITMTLWMTERELLRAYTTNRFQKLLREVDEIGRRLNTEAIRFGGILPGILTSKKLLDCKNQNQEVASIIGRTVERVKVLERLDEPIPIIILGGNGFTGKAVTHWLRERRDLVYSVDRSYMENNEETRNYVQLGQLPESLKTNKVILIDVSCRGALAKEANDLWTGLILLNDVYPEPDPDELQIFEKIGIPVYHLVGMQAKTFPSFPQAYSGGIPCCAAYQSEGSEILVQKL